MWCSTVGCCFFSSLIVVWYQILNKFSVFGEAKTTLFFSLDIHKAEKTINQVVVVDVYTVSKSEFEDAAYPEDCQSIEDEFLGPQMFH